MSEAKDWAGELISGQTGTGRILVSFQYFYFYSFTLTIEVILCIQINLTMF